MKPFLTAEWRDLLILNFVVPTDLLERFVPVGTEPDTWDGHSYVSVVGFRFLGTRVRGWRIPGHQSFPEINFRFYVRRRVGRAIRRGVVFLREVVPKRAVAGVARGFYGEPYVTRPMRSIVPSSYEPRPGGAGIAYSWREDGRWQELRAVLKSGPKPIEEGSATEFITEHYWGYTPRRDETTEYEVRHRRWTVCDIADAWFDSRELKGIDPEVGQCLSGKPAFAVFAVGSEVELGPGHPIGAGI